MASVDPRWINGELFQSANAVVLPYPREVVEAVRKDPWIVHYSTGGKPWKFGCAHPWADEWFENLDQTEFRGWRPTGPTKSQLLVSRTRSVLGRVTSQLGLR